MSNPRVVRMVVVMDVAVTANSWSARHIEGVIDALMQALTTSAQHPSYKNIDIVRYKARTLADAYDTLLEPWEQESR